MTDKPLELAAIREQLANKKGKEYWRCLEELADKEEFRQLLHREFPRQANVWDGALNRRSFLKLMGASLALAGLASCYAPPKGMIVPYVKQPENIVPGRPLYFSTAMTLAGYGMGVLVENHTGRPTKIEGNPDHPASLGATDVFAQASILSLYDPDRSQVITNQGRIRSWDAFLQVFRGAIDSQRGSQGAGLRILTGTVTSPTLADQLATLLKSFPQARWHQYEPVSRDNARAGAQMAFGEFVEPVYHLDRADVVLSLDSDFMMFGPGPVRYAHDFALRRRPGGNAPLSRVYAAESTLTLTGAKADHRLPLRASDMAGFARAVASGLGVAGVSGQAPSNVPANWIPALVKDLQAHRGSSLVIAGEHLPPYVHALAMAMNDALGNSGSTVVYNDPVEANPTNQIQSLRELVNDLGAGRVQLLVILGVNPVYDAPADLNFGAALQKAGLSVHLGMYDDETAALSQWHIPQTHYLEEWGDTRAFDGTATIVQPLIAPLYGGRSAYEILGSFGPTPDSSGHDLVQNYWKSHLPAGAPSDFATFWNVSLNNGTLANTGAKLRTVTLKTDWVSQPPPAPTPESLEIVFRPDPSAYDGRFANNAWLEELPKPFSKITWENPAVVGPTTATKLGVASGDIVELQYGGRTVRAPIWVQPGHADGSVTVYLGYGRTRAGKVGNGLGYSAYALRTSNAPWVDTGLNVVKTHTRTDLATTQGHYMMEGADFVRSATLAEFQKNPNFAQEGAGSPVSLYPGYAYPNNAWGMVIELNACVGCNACVVACQAENNIPIVGKDQVQRGRELHWLRIDNYYAGPAENPEAYFQPVPCMQCETAPCEVVCPVGATVHDSEGINDMVYNRCIGTRYCSNNCPYKVRHFNFYKYADYQTPSLTLLNNPDVSVRERGVMEKCTYCIQRITRARIQAEEEGREIRDGEVLTACQAACPTNAIVFGNLNDQNSRVAQLKRDPRNYALLAELNTRPRTTYEAAIRNPNPEIV